MTLRVELRSSRKLECVSLPLSVRDTYALTARCYIDALAYHTAKTNGLDDLAEDILVEAGMTDEDVPSAPKAGPSSLRTPSVVTSQVEKAWPVKTLGESYFDKALAAGAADGETAFAHGYTEDPDAEQTWLSADEAMSGDDEDADAEDDGWGLDEDVVVPENDVHGDEPTEEHVDLTTDVSPGVPEDELWTRNSPLAVDHAAGGNFESAMQVCLDSFFFDLCISLTQWLCFLAARCSCYIVKSGQLTSNPSNWISLQHTNLHTYMCQQTHRFPHCWSTSGVIPSRRSSVKLYHTRTTRWSRSRRENSLTG